MRVFINEIFIKAKALGYHIVHDHFTFSLILIFH